MVVFSLSFSFYFLICFPVDDSFVVLIPPQQLHRERYGQGFDDIAKKIYFANS